MSDASRPSRAIDAKGRTVRELLAGQKYAIDYYQREYKWQKKQVDELIAATVHTPLSHGREFSLAGAA